MDKSLLEALKSSKANLVRRWARGVGKEMLDGGAEAAKPLRESTRDHLNAIIDSLDSGDSGPLMKTGAEIAGAATAQGLRLSDVLRATGEGRRVLIDYLDEVGDDKNAVLTAIRKVDETYAALDVALARSFRRFEREKIEKEVRETTRQDEELKLLRLRNEEVERAGRALGAMGVELLLLDNRRRVLWANSAARRWFPESGGVEGWTCGQMRGVPPGVCEDCPTSWAIRNKQMERGMVSISREGKREFYEVTTFPMLNEKGDVEQVIELVQDVTHRIRESEEKRQSEEYYRILFEHSGAAVCVLEPDKTIGRTNRRFCQMTGYARHEIEGKMTFLDLVAVDERARMARYHEMRRVNPSGVPNSYEFTFVTRSGEERRANVTVGLVPGTLQSICSIRDITEEEQTKEFLEAVLHDSADAIIGLDTEDRIISWNMGAEQLLGYREPEVIGRHFSILVPKDLIEAGELQRISEETRRVGYIKNYESERVAKDGRRIKINLTRTSLKDKLGKIRGTSAILRDVTEQKTLEQQVIHAEKLAAIGQLTAGLAHEMGTPLNIISGRAEYLLSDFPSDDPRLESLNVIIHQTERMVQLINNLLEFSRPQKVHYARLDVCEVIDGVLTLLETQLGKSKILVDVQCPPEMPHIEADYHQLQQVFLNLILNSVQAMPKGGRIDLKLEPNSDGRTVKAVVSDTGVGISEENLPRIFEPFFTTKDSGQGTGLGLAIVAKIIGDHGGTIGVASPPGKGASFTLTLPLVQSRTEEN